MATLDEVVGKLRKTYGKKIIGTLDETKRDYKRFPFVTPAMSYLFRGGMPRTIVELLGEANVGKSSLSYSIVASAQKTLNEEYESLFTELR